MHFEEEKKNQQHGVYCVGFNYRDDLLIKRDCIEKSWLMMMSKIVSKSHSPHEFETTPAKQKQRRP